MSPLEETIVGGTTRARNEFSRYFDVASKGRPVTIVAGDRSVTMVARDSLIDVYNRLQVAEETIAMLLDPTVTQRLIASREDIKAGRGISPAEAARLLGLEEKD